MTKKNGILLIVLLILFAASPARAAMDTYQFRNLLYNDDVEGMRATLTELVQKGLSSGDLPDLSPYVRSSAMLSLLLSNGMTVDRQALHAFVPPEYPAETTKCLKLLIAAGAEVDAPGYRNETPLTTLAGRTNDKWPETAASVVKTLLDAGANPNARAEGAEPPLFAWRNRSPECVRLLLAAGARIDATREGGTVLYNFGSGQPPEEAAETVRLLLAAGADPNAVHRYTKATSLTTLRENGRSAPVVKALLEGGAKIGPRDAVGRPFLFNWLEDSPEVVRLLLDAGADVNAEEDGITPLIRLAALERSSPHKLEMVRLLLAAGAKADARDRGGRSALLVCGDTLNPQEPRWDLAILRTLLDAGADPNVRDAYGNVLLLSWIRSSPECVRMLLDAGARTDARASDGKTALHYAVSAPIERMEIVKMLLAAGAPVDLPDEEGQTPLMVAGDASEWRNSDASGLLRLLLEAGAKLDARDMKGNTPLMHWIPTSSECAALLLERGADPNAANAAGETPLVRAAIRNRRETVELLADAGADLNVRVEGRNLADEAHRYGGDETVRFLAGRGVKRSLRSYLPEPDVLRKIALGLLLWLGGLIAWGLSVAASSWIVFRKPPEWPRAFGVALGIQLPFLLMVWATGEADAVAYDVCFYLLMMLLAWIGEMPAVILGTGVLAFYYVALFRFILRRPTRARPTWGWAFLLAALALALFVALSSAVPFGDRYFVQDLFGL